MYASLLISLDRTVLYQWNVLEYVRISIRMSGTARAFGVEYETLVEYFYTASCGVEPIDLKFVWVLMSQILMGTCIVPWALVPNVYL